MATHHFIGAPAPRGNFSQSHTLSEPAPIRTAFGNFHVGDTVPLTRFHFLKPGMDKEQFALGIELQSQPFPEAAKTWLDWKRPFLRERSILMYEGYIASLTKLLGDIPLNELTPVHLRTYQSMRTSNAGQIWAKKAGPSCVNHELNTLSQILQHAHLWAPLASFYQALPMPRWTPPRVMSAEDSDKLFTLAARNSRWELAFIAAVLTANTTVSGSELRGLKRKHFEMDVEPCPILKVPSETVKNEYRARVVPLNKSASLWVRQVPAADDIASSFTSQAIWAIPALRMFIAATRSAFSVSPHDTQANLACVGRFIGETCPHSGHVRLVLCGETAITRPPPQACL